MRKIISVILAVFMITCVLNGCGKSNEEIVDVDPNASDFELVKESFKAASKLYSGIFLTQEDVNMSDVIRGTNVYGEEGDMYQVPQANTVEELKDYCRKIYSAEMVKELMAMHSFQETGGKLYIDQTLGLGGPVATAADMRITKDRDDQYTVEIVEYYDYSEEGVEPFVAHLNYVDGNWVWDTIIWGDENIELREVD